MAVVASVSSPANGTVAVNAILTALLGNGYIVKRWSDGTTLSLDNVNLTSNPYGGSGSGAGNLGNSSAWFRVAASDGSREWLFQRGAADQTWTISRTNGSFTGGTPNATTAGTSTAASALFSATQAFPSTGTWRQFISVENAAPYGFTVFGIVLGGGNVRSFISDEPLQSGTTASEDTDAYLWLGYFNASGLGVNAFRTDTTGATVAAYKRFVTAGSNQFVTYGLLINSGGLTVAPANSTSFQVGPTPVGVLEVPLRIPIFRDGASSTTTGWCGYANRHRWGSVGGRANGQTLQQGTSAYWIYCAGVWVPWDATTPSLS